MTVRAGDNSSSSQKGVIIGAVVGGIAGVLLIGTACLLVYHKKRQEISVFTAVGVSGANSYPGAVNRGVYGLPNVAPSTPNVRKASLTPQSTIDPSSSLIVQQREILERALSPSHSDVDLTRTRYFSGSIFDNPHALLSPSTPTSSVPLTPSSATHLMMYPPSPTTDSALLYSP